jgi:hypothetical protein
LGITRSDQHHRHPAPNTASWTSHRMRKLLTAAVLLFLSAQLLWPAATSRLRVPQASPATTVAHDHHQVAGASHDCCPQLPAMPQVQPPLSGPCNDQHRCCMSSNDVAALQQSSRHPESGLKYSRTPNLAIRLAAAGSSNFKPVTHLVPFFSIVLRI